MYDYGVRFYDPALARFTTIDPLTENFSNQSGYLYAYNNPVRFTDYLGMNAVDEVDKEKEEKKKEEQKKEEEKKDDDKKDEKKDEDVPWWKKEVEGVKGGSKITQEDIDNYRKNNPELDIIVTAATIILPIPLKGVNIGKGYKLTGKIGNKFFKFSKTQKASKLPGQARAVYVKIFNKEGKMVKMYKDTYRIDGKFMHRRILKPNQAEKIYLK